MPEALRRWAVDGEGAAEIGWGEPDDYYRCLTVMGRHVPAEEVHGLCGNLHEEATGMSTAEHTKMLAAQGKDHPANVGEHVAAQRNGR
jgi:hypothetical protein